MGTFDIHEAKTNLSRLLERMAAGEEVIISRGGEPIARLVPVGSPRIARVPNQYRGVMWVAEDFDDLPEDLVDGFEGRACKDSPPAPDEGA
jgi:prevent-host-death family protein